MGFLNIRVLEGEGAAMPPYPAPSHRPGRPQSRGESPSGLLPLRASGLSQGDRPLIHSLCVCQLSSSRGAAEKVVSKLLTGNPHRDRLSTMKKFIHSE
ncbi:hypothetical protein CDAR_392371 [Caerostris darwini]|uniref:Uncharacterized protein n=1 Tax=Caerostris darwini TaxID=1538125 RepID=A0AAV4NWZ3_9ARAC|nr:hypothetical protein CDAR_392371 [Caerostris darwini]